MMMLNKYPHSQGAALWAFVDEVIRRAGAAGRADGGWVVAGRRLSAAEPTELRLTLVACLWLSHLPNLTRLPNLKT